MIPVSRLCDCLLETRFAPQIDALKSRIEWSVTHFDHGEKDKWASVLKSIPEIKPVSCHLNRAAVTIGSGSEISSAQNRLLEEKLRLLHPWRKGPYQVFNTFINSEWRSDFKWNRLISRISPLKRKTVLDVGTGNGYHCWRARGGGARIVLGLEPYWLYNFQFYTIRKYLADEPVFVIPLTLQDFPNSCSTFDTVFSMGVFYHVRSPVDHLYQLRSTLVSGGELVLETLVVEGDMETVLIPRSRYAKMRNVWFIPSVLLLESMLKRTGFTHIQLINLNRTTVEEQRSTDWMTFESLSDFLSHENPDNTVEGYPSPRRAIFIAKAP